MPDEELSAEVVLQPAHEPRDAAAPATAATIEEHLPDEDAAERARRWFARRGFTCGPLYAASFSITAPVERFAGAFEMPEQAVTRAAARGGELPLDALPAARRRVILAVAFSPPPDFGPGAP